MRKSEQLNELFGALSKAQAKILPAVKDSANPYFKSKYADLSSVGKACRPALAENGLSVTQIVYTNDKGQIELETTLGHASGQWMSGSIVLPMQKITPQEMGSCISYCKRYALASMVGVYTSDEDDDGEVAMDRAVINKVIEKVRLPVINEDQVQEIYEFLSYYPDCEKDMLKYIGVSKVEEIPSDRFNQVKKIFEAKASKEA